MEPYADVGCVLKVNVHCDACKMKMMDILSSICGVYSVTIDAEEGTAKVNGEVDPNILMRALARSGRHAELVWVKLKHPLLNNNKTNYYYYNNNSNNNNYYLDNNDYGHGHGHGYGGYGYGYNNNGGGGIDDPYGYGYNNMMYRRGLAEKSSCYDTHHHHHQYYYPPMRRSAAPDYPRYGSSNNFYGSMAPPHRHRNYYL